LSTVVIGLVKSIVWSTVGIVTIGTSSSIVEVELSRVIKGVRRDESNVCRRNTIYQGEFNRSATLTIDVGAGLSNTSRDITIETVRTSTVVASSWELHSGGCSTVVDEL
jgi:hypothetical protein